MREKERLEVLRMLRVNPDLSYEPRRVVSIVSGSRCGSTVFKHALTLHPDLCSLAGEEEPYYKLAANGYPWHESDAFRFAENEQVIRMLIANELHNHESAYNRHVMQEHGVEEPPFVTPKECRITDTLVLKTPQNCYRRGVVEQLYPDAEVVYIIVRRDPRATINGLLDGWASPDFTARLTDQGWWKFDMPPGWSWDRDVVTSCIHQWASAEAFLQKDYGDALCEVLFENFERSWIAQCDSAWEMLGLAPFTPEDDELPHLSSTLPPERERWKKRRPWLAHLDLDAVVSGIFDE